MKDIKTLTNPLTFEIVNEIARVIYLRVERRIENPGSRVKHTQESDAESSWDDIKKDEMAKLYAILNGFRKCEKKEVFEEVYLNEMKLLDKGRHFTARRLELKREELSLFNIAIAEETDKRKQDILVDQRNDLQRDINTITADYQRLIIK